MMTRVGLFVLAAAFQVISSQDPLQSPPQGPPPGYPQNFPSKCAGPPPGVKNPQECCLVKPLYTEEELTGCGFQKIEDEAIQHRQGPPDCTKQHCLLQKKGFLNDDKSIKYDSIRPYLDQWVGENPEFEAAVKIAKAVCMGENGPPGPPQICEANRLAFCIGAVLFSECPTWQDTEDCKKLKEHMNECKAPFPN